jgi:quinol-cytochrome oxidoreductase complex cytochrome b subunit
MNEFLNNTEIKSLLEISSVIIAVFISILKIPRLLPKTRSRLFKDLELLEKASKNNFDTQIIRLNLQSELDKMYSKVFKVYNWKLFVFGLISLIILSVFIFLQVKEEGINSDFFWLIITGFVAFMFFTQSFSKPKQKEEKEENEGNKKKSKPIFSITLYSWSSLIFGILLFSFLLAWSYVLNFENGFFKFNGWSIGTIIYSFFGLTMIFSSFSKD